MRNLIRLGTVLITAAVLSGPPMTSVPAAHASPITIVRTVCTRSFWGGLICERIVEVTAGYTWERWSGYRSGTSSGVRSYPQPGPAPRPVIRR
jgi:hypothetical protein